MPEPWFFLGGLLVTAPLAIMAAVYLRRAYFDWPRWPPED